MTTSSPGFELDAELRDLQRFARVARDGELVGAAAELRGEAAAHRLDVRLEDLPHVVHGRLVRQVQVPLERLVHDARAGAAAAVVQIDDGAVEREGLLDLAPVGFVCRPASAAARPAARGAAAARRASAWLVNAATVAASGGAGARRNARRVNTPGEYPYLTVPTGDRMAR